MKTGDRCGPIWPLLLAVACAAGLTGCASTKPAPVPEIRPGMLAGVLAQGGDDQQPGPDSPTSSGRLGGVRSRRGRRTQEPPRCAGQRAGRRRRWMLICTFPPRPARSRVRSMRPSPKQTRRTCTSCCAARSPTRGSRPIRQGSLQAHASVHGKQGAHLHARTSKRPSRRMARIRRGTRPWAGRGRFC